MAPWKEKVLPAYTLFKRTRPYFLLLLAVFTCNGSFAAKSDIDSLINILPQTKDSVKVSVLIKISQFYQSRETEKSLDYCNQALELSQKLGNKWLIGSTYYRFGNIYNGMGDYTKAHDMLLKGYSLFDSIHYYRGMANCANSIGNIYLARKDTVNMFKYYNLALENALRSNEPGMIAVVKVGLGNVYQTQQQHQKAISFFTDASEIFKKLNQKMEYAVCQTNIGSSYLQMGNYKKAEDILSACRPIAQEAGNKYVIALTIAQEGQAKEGLKKYEEAIALFYKALAIAKEIKARDNISEMYSYLADAYAGIHKTDSAYMYARMFSALKDSIFNEESARQSAEMEAKYETAKKDKELVEKDAELEKNKLDSEKRAAERNTFIVGFILVLVLAGFMYRSYNQKKNDAIEISKQKAIIEEKNKDITDSMRYALNIQEAILPPADLMYRHLQDHFVFFLPKDIVSGDFYWLHTQDDQVLVAAMDCTGHGVPGALMSVVGHNALKEAAATGDLRPSALMTHMCQQLHDMFISQYRSTSINDGMDAAICLIDRKKMKLQFGGAHNPLYLVRNGSLTEIKGNKRSISGQDEEMKGDFTDHDLDLEKGDSIYIFSDGFADQFGGPDGKKFKYSKFKELILSIQGRRMNDQRNALQRTFEEWKESADPKGLKRNIEQIDDVLVIGIKI